MSYHGCSYMSISRDRTRQHACWGVPPGRRGSKCPSSSEQHLVNVSRQSTVYRPLQQRDCWPCIPKQYWLRPLSILSYLSNWFILSTLTKKDKYLHSLHAQNSLLHTDLWWGWWCWFIIWTKGSNVFNFILLDFMSNIHLFSAVLLNSPFLNRPRKEKQNNSP